MAFSNLFRRHSTSHEIPAANYAYLDENSTAETLLDELEVQCQNSSTLSSLRNKRNSDVLAHRSGFLASTYGSSSKRRSSVDYSWLTPQNNPLQASSELYHLPDMIKMELSELIRSVSPENCALVVNNFRRHIRAQTQATTPEMIIALFRKILADYVDQKAKSRVNSNETVQTDESNLASSKTLQLLVRNNRVLPRRLSEEEQHSIAELGQISLSSSRPNDSGDVKPRSNTHV